jgi:hypothetical protein
VILTCNKAIAEGAFDVVDISNAYLLIRRVRSTLITSSLLLDARMSGLMITSYHVLVTEPPSGYLLISSGRETSGCRDPPNLADNSDTSDRIDLS